MRAGRPQQEGPPVTTGCLGAVAAGNGSFLCEPRVGANLGAENPYRDLVPQGQPGAQSES